MAELEDWFHKYNSWSFSKHRLWGQCKLSYYYRYIATALKSPKNLDIPKLKKLKDLTPKFALQGKLLHQVLENHIEQLCLGREMSESWAIKRYVPRVEYYRRTATENLIEFFNGETVDPAFFNRIQANGIEQLATYFGTIWPQLKDRKYLKHEKFDKFSAGDVPAMVKVDYVSEARDGVIVLSDWKTGKENGDAESDLQMGVYTLWAMQNYNKDSGQIRSELVYLASGRIQPYEFKRKHLQYIRDTIIEDFRTMNEGFDIDRFEPDPHPSKCLSCNFATVCPHSMATEALEGETASIES